ncbi:hypothetical protein P9112_003080 [Eukaryota sp. TZLM1-RC]
MDISITSLGTYCSLVTVADTKILLDIGLEPFHPGVPFSDRSCFLSLIQICEVDAVLISCSTHADALPFLVNDPFFTAQIVLTHPVYCELESIIKTFPKRVQSCITVATFGERVPLSQLSYSSTTNRSSDTLYAVPFPNGSGLGSSLFTLSYSTYSALLVTSLSSPDIPHPLPLPSVFDMPENDPLYASFPSSFSFIFANPPPLPTSDSIDHLADPSVSLERYFSDLTDDLVTCCTSHLDAGKNVFISADVTDTTAVLSVLTGINSKVGSEVKFFIIGKEAPDIYPLIATSPQYLSCVHQQAAFSNSPDQILVKSKMEFSTKSAIIPVTVTEKSQFLKQLKRKRTVYCARSFKSSVFQEMFSPGSIILGGGRLFDDPEFNGFELKKLGKYIGIFVDPKAQAKADTVVKFDVAANEVFSEVQHYYYPMLYSFGPGQFLGIFERLVKKSQSKMIGAGPLGNFLTLPNRDEVNAFKDRYAVGQYQTFSFTLNPKLFDSASLSAEALGTFHLDQVDEGSHVGLFSGNVKSSNVCESLVLGNEIDVGSDVAKRATPSILIGSVSIKKLQTLLENAKLVSNALKNTTTTPNGTRIKLTQVEASVTLMGNQIDISASSYSIINTVKEALRSGFATN